MGRKIIEIPMENNIFRATAGLMHQARSQKMSLDWASVWEGKSLKFLRISGVSGADAPGAVAENEPRLGLSMERKIIEIPKENQRF